MAILFEISISILLFKLALMAACGIAPLAKMCNLAMIGAAHDGIIGLQLIHAVAVVDDVRFSVEGLARVVNSGQLIKLNHFKYLHFFVVVFFCFCLSTLYHKILILSRKIFKNFHFLIFYFFCRVHAVIPIIFQFDYF